MKASLVGRWFGRDKEEDPLAGLRGDGDSSISSMGPSGRTEGSGGAGSSGLSSSSPEGPRKRSGVGAAIVFALIVLGTYGAMIVYLENESDGADKTSTSSVSTTSTVAAATATEATTTETDQASTTTGEAKVPKAKPLSLLGSSGLKRAFTAINKNIGATDRIAWFRVQSDRANVTVTSKSGVRMLTVTPDLEVGSVDAGSAGNDTVSPKALSASGLNRAIATATKKSGNGRSKIDYVVLFGSPPGWSIFFKDDAHTLWRASIDGREVNSVGGTQ